MAKQCFVSNGSHREADFPLQSGLLPSSRQLDRNRSDPSLRLRVICVGNFPQGVWESERHSIGDSQLLSVTRVVG